MVDRRGWASDVRRFKDPGLDVMVPDQLRKPDTVFPTRWIAMLLVTRA